MATTAQVRNLRSVIQARGNALRTTPQGTAEWPRALLRLQEALRDANAIIEGGRGSVDNDVWQGFLETVQRQSYSVNQEMATDRQGQAASYDMDFAPAGGGGSSSSFDRERVAAGDRTGRAVASNNEVVARADEREAVTDANRWANLWADDWENKTGVHTSSWAWFRTWLLAPGAPVYRKPIVIGTAAVALAATTYVAVKAATPDEGEVFA